MAGGKRYNRQRAQVLLARVFAVLSAPEVQPPRLRHVYLDLLQARLSDVEAADAMRDAVRAATDADIILWRTNLRSILGLVDQLRHWSRTPALPEVAFSGVTLTVLRGNDVRLVLVGIPKQLLLLQLMTLVRLAGPDLMQRCDCGRLFARVGKRRYCRTRCQKRVYMRDYRADL